MSLYRNTKRAEDEDAELERLEKEYREQYGEASALPATPEPEISKEEETWKERYSNLKSYADKTRNELTKKITELERAVQNSNRPVKPPVDKEEVREWMLKYPELSATLKAIIREELDYDREELTPRLEELETVKRDIEYSRAFNKILSVHPDFEDLIRNEDFVSWVDRQPEEKGKIGELIYASLRQNLDPDDAIRSITMYKQETKASKRKPAVREAATAIQRSAPEIPETNGKRSFSESQVEKMSIREYEKLEQEIDDAKRDGRFVYDLSGAAR